MIDDGGRFLDRWGSKAAMLGWSAIDVFGIVRSLDSANRPVLHLGQPIGLVPLIGGGNVVAISAETAIQRPSGATLSYLRRPVPWVWELVQDG